MQNINRKYSSLIFLLLAFVFYSHTCDVAANNNKNLAAISFFMGEPFTNNPDFHTINGAGINLLYPFSFTTAILNMNSSARESKFKNGTEQHAAVNVSVIILIIFISITVFLFVIQKLHKHYRTLLQNVVEENNKLKQESEFVKSSYHTFWCNTEHDIKNRLNSLNSATSLIHQHYNSLTKDEKNTLAELILKSSEQLGAYLENLTIWSNLSVGNIENVPEELDLANMISRVKQDLNQYLELKNLSINTEVFVETKIIFDEKLLYTVLKNLFMNSIKYSDSGKEIKVKSKEVDGKIELKISDSGIGVDNFIIKNLFKLSSISSQPGTEGEKGSGLGLLICSKILEASKSQISLQNNYDQGTTVVLIIPGYEL